MLFALLLFCCAACLYPVQTKAVQLKRNENYIYCDSSEYDGIEILEYRGEGGSVTVPEEIEGKPVRVIGKYAFKWKAAFIKDVRLPDTVSLIKESAFAGCSMERIKLPLNLCKFERFALAGCDNLQTIDLPQSLTELSDALFEGSGLVQIVIPENITCINSGAFMLCHNLERVVFAEGSKLNTIGQGAFSQCMRLKELELPDKEVIVPDSVVEIKDNAFLKCSAEKIVLPENLKKMGIGVFMDCKNLKTVELPDCLTEIPEYSFNYSGIEKIVIPRNVRSLGSEAFAMCGELKEVVFEAESNLKEIGTACFWDCGKLKKIAIPGKVKKIKNLAFENCEKLRQILFFGAVPKFGGGAFCNIDKKAVFKVPAKYKSKYAKKLNKQTGYLKKTMRIKTI